MHVHILGIGGTFMGGIALLGRAAGHEVTGSDQGLYPPMSTQLEAAGIAVHEGYDPAQFEPRPDQVIIGNALSRGNPAVEYVLDQGLDYVSGPQWLAENVLRGRWVLAVAGTHGKTTTASMLAWILEFAGLAPGYLIGGVPGNFEHSARFGRSDFFVVEADEYDTAFFDKRSKFVHYRPRTLVLNNLEYDHADIFDDLEAIKRQFHHLLRTVPASGQVIFNQQERHLEEVLARGCWSQTLGFNDPAGWRHEALRPGGDRFCLHDGDDAWPAVEWSCLGQHNLDNALAATLAARHAGVSVEVALEALAAFRSPRRRMELRGTPDGVAVYDDFAHHPTAIATSLAGLRAQDAGRRIVAILEPRSNTMRMGTHGTALAHSLAAADMALVYAPDDLAWDANTVLARASVAWRTARTLPDLLQTALEHIRPGDRVVIMSNGGFGGFHQMLLDALADRASHGG